MKTKLKSDILFAKFLGALVIDAAKHPEKLHKSKEVWDKEWDEILMGQVDESIKGGFIGEEKSEELLKNITSNKKKKLRRKLKMKKQAQLMKKIEEYLTPEIGQAIIDGVDLIVRLRLGQVNIVADILKRNCSIHQEGKGPDLDEPLYRAIELGEYLKCLKDHPDCDKVEQCWITRKGFAPCRQEYRRKQ